MLDYIPSVFVKVDEEPWGFLFLIINNFSQSFLRLRYMDQMFPWFLEHSLWSYRENEVRYQKRYLEISCEYAGEVHLLFALNLEQVCGNITYVSVKFLEHFTASTNNISLISFGRLVIA